MITFEPLARILQVAHQYGGGRLVGVIYMAVSRLLAFVIAGVILTACEQGSDGPPTVEAPTVSASEELLVEPTQPPAFPSYATAMETLQPLGPVKGAQDGEVISAVNAAAGDFSEAIAYARDTGSYALLIWQGGALQVEEYFSGHDKELKSESASMHKSVAGLVVQVALSEGAISSVDNTVDVYIPEWADDPRGQITIRQLLTMTSGLGGLSFEGGPTSPGAQYVMDGAVARAATLSLPLERDPGSYFQYSNPVTQILLMVVEAATGEPYQQYLSEKVWKPIGASDAYVWLNEEDGFPRAYTSLLAAPRDWLKIGQLYKDGGVANGQQIIPSEIMAQATAPSALNPNYGWQIWRGETYEPRRYYNADKIGASFGASAPYAADDILFFDGFGGQRVYISRSNDLVIVRLGDARMDWDDAMLPNLVLGAMNE